MATAQDNPKTAKRQRNKGLRKLCACGRERWNKCSHPWYFNFTWQGTIHRFCLDRHVGQPIAGKKKAEDAAEKLRIAIRAGCFNAEQPREDARPAPPETLSVRALGAMFVKGFSQQAAGRAKARRKGALGAKASWRNDRSMLNRFYAFTVPETDRHLGEMNAADVKEGDVEASSARSGQQGSPRARGTNIYRR
jgi:hypothetical protein